MGYLDYLVVCKTYPRQPVQVAELE